MDDPERQAKLDALRDAAKRKTAEAARARETEDERVASNMIAAGQRSTSRYGMFANPDWWFVIWTIIGVGVLFAIVAFVARMMSGSHHGHGVEFIGLDAITLGGVGALVNILARGSVRRGVERELDWVRRLPFRLENHFALLSSGYGRVQIRFVENAPKDWQELVQGVNARWMTLEAKRVNDKLVTLDVQPPRGASGHELWAAWRTVVSDLLIPVHASHPIEITARARASRNSAIACRASSAMDATTVELA